MSESRKREKLKVRLEKKKINTIIAGSFRDNKLDFFLPS